MHISIDKEISKNCQFLTFNGGEEHCEIVGIPETNDEDNSITFSILNPTSKNLIRLMIAVNTIRNSYTGKADIELVLPYIPGGRQDRIDVYNDKRLPLTIKAYADFINAMDFNHVYTIDPHSDVTPAVINNCGAQTHRHIFDKTIYSNHYAGHKIFLFPDAGAAKKYEKQYADLGDIEFCTKKRNMETGTLSDTVVPDVSRYTDSWIFIIDDICDGGRTFLNMAEKMGRIAKTNTVLSVTHGIFSQGIAPLCNTFREVITTNSVSQMRKKEYDMVGGPLRFNNFTEIDLYKYFGLE